MEGKCCIDCIDHAIGDKDFCGFPKCTCHFKKKDTWEERFEEESPLALGGRAWAKSFIASEITKARIEVLEEIEKEQDYVGDDQRASILKGRTLNTIQAIRTRILQQQNVPSPNI